MSLRWVLALLTTACLFVFSSLGFARSYSLDRIEVTGEVRSDGSMHVTELREVTFEGTFHAFDREIPLRPGESLRNVSVSEHGEKYVRDESERPGTYHVSYPGNGLKVSWGYEATDETRTFLLEYDVLGAVVKHADAGELYWRFIEPEHEWEAERSRVEVKLPGHVPKEHIQVWAHGPLHGRVDPVAGGAVATCDPLPSDTLVELRLLFPAEVLTARPSQSRARAGVTAQEGALAEQANRERDAARTTMREDQRNVRARVMEEEGALAGRANRQRDLARVEMGLPLLLALLMFAMWLALYLRYGREYQEANPPEYTREPLEGWKPNDVGYLCKWGHLDARDMTAMVMDLVRRGVLRLEVKKAEYSGLVGLAASALKLFGAISDEEQYLTWLPDSTGELSRSESYLLDSILFRDLGRGGVISMSEFREQAKGDPQGSYNRFQVWKRMAEKESEKLPLVDPASNLAMIAAITTFAVIAVISVMTAAANERFTFLLPAITGVVLAAASVNLRRRNRAAALALHQWQAFQRYLEDFSQLKQYPAPAVVLWEQYLVFAITLGVADRVIEQFKALYPIAVAEHQGEISFFPNWIGTNGAPFSAMESLGSALSSFSTNFATATSSYSSPSGGGGGFSGGGGGGGGGGGSSGAR